MRSLCGSDWEKYFDLIICNARKPYFFSSSSKPFRKFNLKTNSKSWAKLISIKKGDIYYEGNMHEMLKCTGWSSHNILYFGDHIYGDLGKNIYKKIKHSD